MIIESETIQTLTGLIPKIRIFTGLNLKIVYDFRVYFMGHIREHGGKVHNKQRKLSGMSDQTKI